MYSTASPENSVTRLLKSLLRDVAPAQANTVSDLQSRLLSVSKQHKSLHSSVGTSPPKECFGIKAKKERLLEHPKRAESGSLVGYTSSTGCFPYLRKKPFEYVTNQIITPAKQPTFSHSTFEFLKKNDNAQYFQNARKKHVKQAEDNSQYISSTEGYSSKFPFRKKKLIEDCSKTAPVSPQKSKQSNFLKKNRRQKKSKQIIEKGGYYGFDSISPTVLEELSENSAEDSPMSNTRFSLKRKSDDSTVENTVVTVNEQAAEEDQNDQKKGQKKYRRSQVNSRISVNSKISGFGQGNQRKNKLSGIVQSFQEGVAREDEDIWNVNRKKDQATRSSFGQNNTINARSYRKRQKRIIVPVTMDETLLKKLLSNQKQQDQKEQPNGKNDCDVKTHLQIQTQQMNFIAKKINDILKNQSKITEFLILPEDSAHVKAIKMAGLKEYLYLTNNNDSELWELINEFESRLQKCIQRYIELNQMDSKQDRLLLENILMKVDMTQSELKFTDNVNPVAPAQMPNKRKTAQLKQKQMQIRKIEFEQNEERCRIINSSIIAIRQELQIVKPKKYFLKSQSMDKYLVQKQLSQTSKFEPIAKIYQLIEPQQKIDAKLVRIDRKKDKIKNILKMFKNSSPQAFRKLLPQFLQ